MCDWTNRLFDTHSTHGAVASLLTVSLFTVLPLASRFRNPQTSIISDFCVSESLFRFNKLGTSILCEHQEVHKP